MPDIASQQHKNKNQRELKTSQKIVQKDYATEKMLLIVSKAPSTV
jgi:hypothetical protein